MATKKSKGNRGGGDLDQQINRLKEKVGPKGRKLAQEICDSYDAGVIKLAFKMTPKGPATSELGTRIEAMLANMPKTQAEETRASLLAAKAKG